MTVGTNSSPHLGARLPLNASAQAVSITHGNALDARMTASAKPRRSTCDSPSAVSPSKPYFTTDDLRWGATYLITSQDKDYTCLNTLACLDPENASDYVTGCKLMLKGAKVVSGVIPR